MTNKQKENLTNRIKQVTLGTRVETNKYEFKARWYNLAGKSKTAKGQSVRHRDYYEFIKDCTSIINSYGGDEGYIIIGVGADGSLQNSKIEDSGLNDPSLIKEIIVSAVDTPFIIDIDYLYIQDKDGIQYQLSVIHIPPSASKPHLITRFINDNGHIQENVIWLRNGSGKVSASKADIDRMYIERGNISFDFRSAVILDLTDCDARVYPKYLTITFEATFINTGTRSLVFNRCKLAFDVSSHPTLGILGVLTFHGGSNGVTTMLKPNDVAKRTLFFDLALDTMPHDLKAELNTKFLETFKPDAFEIILSDTMTVMADLSFNTAHANIYLN